MDTKLQNAVKRLKEGDKQAFDEIFQEEYAKVFARVKTSMVGFDQSDVEDVVQDVFIKVYEKIDTLENIDTFEGWLSRIARNTAINEIERRKKIVLFQKVSGEEEEIFQEDLLENEYIEFQPEESLSQKEIEENLFEILANLPNNLSMCLQMKEYDGMSYQEIADELGISLSSVKNNIFQCKKKIKEEMQKRKLYSVAPIPYFLWLYKSFMDGVSSSTVEAESVWRGVEKALAEKVAGQSTTQVAGTAAGELAKGAVAKTAIFGGMSAGKIAAIIASIAVIGTLGTIGVMQLTKPIDITPVLEETMDEKGDDNSNNTGIETGEEISKETDTENASVKESEDAKETSKEDNEQEELGKIVKPTEDDFAKLDMEVYLLDLIGSSKDVEKIDLEKQMYLLITYAGYDLERGKIKEVPNHNREVFQRSDSIYVMSLEDFIWEMHARLNRFDITKELMTSTNWSGTEKNAWNTEFSVEDGNIYYYFDGFGWMEEYEYDKYTILEESEQSYYIRCDYNFVPSGMEENTYAFSYYLRGCVREDDTGRYWSFTEWRYDNPFFNESDTQTAEGIHIENVHFKEEQQTEYPISGDEYWATEPVVNYTLQGIEKTLTFEDQRDYFMPYSELGPQYGYDVIRQVKDITGDGNEELIVHFVMVGNNVSDLYGTTYVFSYDSETQDLIQTLKIGPEDGANYKSGFTQNVGVCAQDGWLELNLMQKDGTYAELAVVNLTYENGQWIANEFDGMSSYYGQVDGTL